MIDWNALLGQIITVVVQAVVVAVVPTVTYIVVRGVKQAVEQGVTWLRMKVGDKTYGIVQDAVVISVQAAEQAGLKKLILDEGKAKKAYALAYLQAVLDSRGIKVPLAELEGEIEAALLQGWHKVEEEDTPTPAAIPAVHG